MKTSTAKPLTATTARPATYEVRQGGRVVFAGDRRAALALLRLLAAVRK